MVLAMSGVAARAPGRDATYPNGLFMYNREDMTFEAWQRHRRAGRWKPDDLFALYRDEFGGMHVQYARYEDYAEIALTQLVRRRNGMENVSVDKSMLLHLVGIIMMSRVHGYHFDQFTQLLDHNGDQIFDFRGICEWIAMHEDLFITDAEIAVEEDANDMPSLERDWDELPQAKVA